MTIDNEIQKEENTTRLELYKIAHSQLQFQDEYLFKFSAVFMTAEGALGALVKAAFEKQLPIWVLIISILGVILSAVWVSWVRHNDYWHSVWTGSLREIETGLPTSAVNSN